jgi:Transposase family tnp2
MREYLPQPNHAPENYYETKSTVKDLGMPVVKIDVCKNSCMLYWGADEKLLQCKFCSENRYKPRFAAKKKLIPWKKMYYLPLANRLQRLYESQRTAPHMRWHAEHAAKPGEMKHPSDGKAWKDFNAIFRNFASEPRNVYLCLCTDGFAPYGQSGGNYSLWPVIMSPYNLPPDMCLKREVMFLTLLIPGREHPKKSFDVFLQPLIKELKDLWLTGVPAFDVSQKQNFTLKAVLLWTISDFPAYGMLSGWSTHGKLACPYCMEETDSFRLDHGKKPCWYVKKIRNILFSL